MFARIKAFESGRCKRGGREQNANDQLFAHHLQAEHSLAVDDPNGFRLLWRIRGGHMTRCVIELSCTTAVDRLVSQLQITEPPAAFDCDFYAPMARHALPAANRRCSGTMPLKQPQAAGRASQQLPVSDQLAVLYTVIDNIDSVIDQARRACPLPAASSPPHPHWPAT